MRCSIADGIGDKAFRAHIESFGRLIDHEQGRIREHDLRKGEQLLLTSGKIIGMLVEHMA